jgi:hypothetical protein
VLRVWVEQSNGQQVRARVLAIQGSRADMHELGVAAGVSAILELVSEGLSAVAAGGDD